GVLDVAFAGDNSHDWDLAAADLLVHEAGGALTTTAGKALTYNSSELVHGALLAAGQERHAALIGLLRNHPELAGWLSMRLLKRMTASRWFQVAVGVLAAEYLRLVWKTNRFVIEPPNGYEQFDADPPGIAVFWHGQHLMTPFLSRRHRVKVIISRH